jgi:beta-mannosidase
MRDTDRDEQLLAWTVEIGPAVDVAPGPPSDDLARDAVRARGALPAQVPGSVHVDLITAGIIDDLTVRGRDDEQLWVAQTPWRYRTTLHRPPRPYERAVLVLEGIDTLGRVSVGGRLRLTNRNMFRRHEIDVTAELARGDAVDVVVDLLPVLPAAQARELTDPLPRPAAYWRPFNQVRKMACSFGWDWGPTTMTAGLWRPAYLSTWTGGRLADVRVSTRPGAPDLQGEVQAAEPTVAVDVAVQGQAHAVRVVVAEVGEGSAAPLAVATALSAGGRAQLTVPVRGARTWWPHTEGERPLYDVTVSLLDDGQRVVDERRLRVGFRTVEVVQEPDADGMSFAVHVNGRRVWVRGLDWIPDDPFPARITPERYRARLAEAVAAGANAVRVWGGGIYEDDAFYDACDELGLLVVQDFLFACAAYPEDEETVEEVRAEVRDNVRRLRHRASLALWCGNNENLWGHEDWEWKDALGGRPWGARYYDEILPDLLAEVDGTRPYVPGSPFSPDSPDGSAHHPNDPGRGMQHIWDVWNQRDYTEYETWRPRFVSEFGYQAPASWPTLVTALGGPPDPADPQLHHHQRADDGMAKLQAGLDRHLQRPPEGGPGWYFATQLLQARALVTGVTHLRSLHDLCSGAIWWQLNDMWPAVSWSVIDVRGRRKLAWYALRRSFDGRLVTITSGVPGPAGKGTGGVRVVLVNDTAQAWADRLVVRIARSAGTAGGPEAVDVVVERDIEVAANDSCAVDVDVDVDGPRQALVVVADVGARRATRWLAPDTILPLSPQDAEVRVGSGQGRSAEVSVTARSLLRDVCLLAELAVPDAVVSDQLLTLLPGESAVIRVELPDGGTTADTVDWATLVWSDNRLREPDGVAARAAGTSRHPASRAPGRTGVPTGA